MISPVIGLVGPAVIVAGVFHSAGSPHISTVIREFPDERTQHSIEQLIEKNIVRFAKTLSSKTLSPKTLTFSGKRIICLKS